MKQHGMRQVSYDTEVGKITTDSGCDVHFTKNRRPSKLSSREASTLELNPMTAAEVEQAALARELAAFGTPGPAAGPTLDRDGEPTVRIRVPTRNATPSPKERALHEASGNVPYRSWGQW